MSEASVWSRLAVSQFAYDVSIVEDGEGRDERDDQVSLWRVVVTATRWRSDDAWAAC